MKAKVARFYGWSDNVINNMGLDKFHEYWLMITPLEAQESLLSAKICAYPHMKKPSAKKFISEMRRACSRFIDKTGGEVKSYKDVLSKIQRTIRDGR